VKNTVIELVTNYLNNYITNDYCYALNGCDKLQSNICNRLRIGFQKYVIIFIVYVQRCNEVLDVIAYIEKAMIHQKISL